MSDHTVAPTRAAIPVLIAVTEWDKPYNPSIRDITAMVGLKSRSTTLTHLRQLRRLGYVDWYDGKARTLHITEKGKEALHVNQ